MKKEFKGKLVPRGAKGAWAFLHIPFDVQAVFGSRARVPVSGTINGFALRNSLMPEGDRTHAMMVGKAIQAGAKARSGDTVSVVLQRDDAERTVEVPAELTGALAKNKKAAATFATLPPSGKKEYSDWIAGAKQVEMKARRVAKALQMLAAGQRRLD
jgi:hypothetical protein